MRGTRFIFVEGIMGSGKTTTALFLAERLQQHGISAEFMSEGGPPRVALDLPHGVRAVVERGVLRFAPTPRKPNHGRA